MTGDVLGLDEVHVLGREAHRLPVEAAFEQEGPAGPRLRGRKLWAAPWKPCSSSALRLSLPDQSAFEV